MSTETSYSWLKQLPRDILNLAPASMYGNPPPFDIQAFSKELSQILETPVDIKTSLPELKEASKTKEGFSEDASQIISLRVAPFRGFVHLLLPKDVFIHLVQKDLPKDYPIDPSLIEAFKEYVLASAISAFQKAHPDKTLAPQIAPGSTVVESHHLTQDIELSLLGMKFPARILIDQDFLDTWREKFKAQNPSNQVLKELYLDIHVEAGRVSLSRSDFKTLESGDFLILDSCQLIPGDEKKRVLLTLNHKPIFRAKLKDGKVKILEYPLLYEDKNIMAKDPSHDEEIEEEYHEDTTDEYTEEEEELDEDEEIGEAKSAKSANGTASPSAVQEAKPINANEIPLDIVVEVGRFKITVQKLSELKPGDILDLNFRPEEGVNLIANGHFIAKGELLKIGDLIGVRILDIAGK